MVMDQFVTTYRKDYLWPYVRTFGFKPDPNSPCIRKEHILCDCHCINKPQRPDDRSDVFGPHAVKEDAWSRLGPMGPLLDPKLYPAKVGPSPESDTNRFNQPNVFLKKLQEKYPFIYECLRNAPPDDLISRINRDRLRTTYQVDYNRMNEYPDAPYDELIRAAGAEGLPPCPEPVRLPGDPCRPNQKPIAFRPHIISGMGPSNSQGQGGQPDRRSGNNRGSAQNRSGAGGNTGGTTAIILVTTEYQDGISKLGHMIMKENLFIRSKQK